MTIDFQIQEAEHNVVYAIGPSKAEEINVWYKELHGKSISDFSTIIHRLQQEYQKDLLLVFSLIRFTDIPTRTWLYKREKYYSMYYEGNESINMIERTDSEWFYYRIIPEEEGVPSCFYENSIPAGQKKSVIILIDKSDIDDSIINSVRKMLEDSLNKKEGSIKNDDCISITYHSVGVDGHSITVHHGKYWPPKLYKISV